MRGVVHRNADVAVYEVGRVEVGPSLQPFVEHLWWANWSLRGHPTRTVMTIPFPSLHLTVEQGTDGELRHGHQMPAVLVHGVPTRAFTVDLSSAGWVLGAKFHPGGWAAWSGRDAGALTDRVVAAAALDQRWADAGRAVLAAVGHRRRVELLHEQLAEFAAEPDTEHLQVRRLTERMAAQPAMRITDLAASVGWSPRTLQRQFRRLVGVSPKWVLMRYRLQEAALQLEQHPSADLTDIALGLGWYDQSHLSEDFRRVLGTTPGRYAERARTSRTQDAQTVPRRNRNAMAPGVLCADRLPDAS